MLIINKLFKKFVSTNKGFSIIEISVTIGLLSIILPSIILYFVTLNQNKHVQSKRLVAQLYLSQAQEAIRQIKQNDFNELLQSGLYHINFENGEYSLEPGQQIIDNTYTRKILISNVQRNDNGDIVELLGTNDPNTKKITISVFYSDGVDDFIEDTFYISRTFDNSNLIYTTQTDFLDGDFNNVEITNIDNGEISLKNDIENSFYTNEYNISDDYLFDSNKIKIENGYASLKNINTSLNSTLNPYFDDDLNNYDFIQFEDTSVSSVKLINKNGNPDNFALIEHKKEKESISYSFLSQSFNVSNEITFAELNFDYKIIEYNDFPDDFRVLVYLDSHNNYPTNLIYDSGTILQTSNWNSILNLDVSSYLQNQGTYYLKVGVFVDYPSNKTGPYQVGFDNILLTYNGDVEYPSDNPTISFDNSVELNDLISYSQFSAQEILNGQNIYYQLSNDSGENWYFYNGSEWQVSQNDTDYNTQSEIDENISTFDIGDSRINVKAFLSSNGENQVMLDNISIEYKSGSLNTSGSYTSKVYDFNKQVGLNRIIFDSSEYDNTDIKLHIAVNNDNDVFNFVGPDSTSETFFTSNSDIINLNNVLGRYFKYKIYLTNNGSISMPYVDSINLNYSP